MYSITPYSCPDRITVHHSHCKMESTQQTSQHSTDIFDIQSKDHTKRVRKIALRSLASFFAIVGIALQASSIVVSNRPHDSSYNSWDSGEWFSPESFAFVRLPSCCKALNIPTDESSD
jgi:hypothetical protein